ncbi:MAG: hypothetical protein JW723_06120 [Bacteroidales bacterium]|nr:hypothetical protein [Bacteroidales bacterium]
MGDQFPGITGLPFALEVGTGFGTDLLILKAGVYPEGYYIKPSLSLFKDLLALEGYFTCFPRLYSTDLYYWPHEKFDRFGFSIWYNFH